MANVEQVSDHPALVETSPSEQVIALEPNREYSVTHLGLNVAGDMDTALVFCAVEQLVGADLLPRDDKLVLRGLATATLGPGIGRLAVRSPGGAALVQLIPGPHRYGAW